MDTSVTPPTAPATRRDPVCGMDLTPDQVFMVRQVGTDLVYFCSSSCVQKFEWGRGISLPRPSAAPSTGAAFPGA